MPNWSQLAKSYLEKSDPDGLFKIVTGPPASAEALGALEAQLGFELPQEFRSLYSVMDGIGHFPDGEPEETIWLFYPTGQIGSLCDRAREWFGETHEDYANRFFPFIDWNNGDSMGYFLDDSGQPMDGLFCLEHELYGHDEAQDVNEFLSCWAESIKEVLTQG